MFVQSEKFIESHGGKLGDVAIFGQESNPATWRLAAMNLAIRGIYFNLGHEPGDTFTKNQHPDLRADFILANPPFNISDWWHGSLTGDPRWEFGDPPAGNANYAWLQHMLYHLNPSPSLVSPLLMTFNQIAFALLESQKGKVCCPLCRKNYSAAELIDGYRSSGGSTYHILSCPEQHELINVLYMHMMLMRDG